MTPKQRRLIELLELPKSCPAVSQALNRPKLTPEELWRMVPPGHEMFENKDQQGASVFKLAPTRELLPIQPRVWNYVTPHEGKPWIWVQFPKAYKHDRIRLRPLSDVHIGAKGHNEEDFDKELKLIAEDDQIFTFLNGDILDFALGDSIGGAVYDSYQNPKQQVETAIRKLRPIAHKILWAQPGNHEWRGWKHANLDPTWFICMVLGIPYFDEPIYADVLAWGQRFTFFCHHGSSGSGTKGGKLNAASRPGEFQESLNFVIMGHVHDSMTNAVTKMRRKRVFDGSGAVKKVHLEEHAQYIVVLPSFYKYFGTYGARAGYAPGSWGQLSCMLYNSGRYRVEE